MLPSFSVANQLRLSSYVFDTCVSHGPQMDYHAWMEGRVGDLVQELLAAGGRAMNVWQWDQFGGQTHHAEIL